MAKETSTTETSTGDAENAGGMSPAKRRRLQQCFEHGSKVAAAGNFDYATDMYTHCVVGDPGNPLYVKSFLGNLQKKYNNNKKGSKFAGMKTAGSKAAIKKCGLAKDWAGIIANGLEVLKINPWDTYALSELARVCEQQEFGDCQLEYLKMALDADMKDVEVNRLLGRAYARVGQYDQAIVCFQRVKQAKPTDEEANRAVSDLTVERTITKGGYETAKSSTEVRAGKATAVDLDDEDHLTPQQRLERAIKKDPTDIDRYIELADIHLRDEHLDAAEEVLTRAVEASGGDLKIREQLEDVQLKRARQQLAIAEKQAREQRTEQAVNLYNQLKSDVNNQEMLVYQHRCDRYPTNTGFRFELAVRLQRAKKYNDAIKMLQDIRGDLKRKADVFYCLGECFAAIKQYRLALANFDSAAEEFHDRDVDKRKRSLYNAGQLAVHLKDLDAAEKHFSKLAAMDFGYKDVSQWLDKIAKLREDGPQALEE